MPVLDAGGGLVGVIIRRVAETLDPSDATR